MYPHPFPFRCQFWYSIRTMGDFATARLDVTPAISLTGRDTSNQPCKKRYRVKLALVHAFG